MNNYFFFFLIFLNLYSQKESPFENLNFIKIISNNNNEIYKKELDKLRANEAPEIDIIKKEIFLATKFRDIKKIIILLNRQIEIEGESPDLLYQLGGTNGILASQKKNFFSIIYLNEMLNNFSKALDLDPYHIPTLEAYIDALYSVPKILGGDKKKALKLAERLNQVSKIDGHLSMAMIYYKNGNNEMSNFYLNIFFEELSSLLICGSENSKVFFSKKANNFPIKISQITSFFGKEVDSGLCALNFYMESSNFKKNLYSLEWIYYLKSKLAFLNGNREESIRLINLSLNLNPEFELSKTFLKKNF
ncbi:MAG: tetratricopeptide repeat protein [Flavobacteriaceae bacterium]